MSRERLLVFDLGNVILNLDFDRFVNGVSRASGVDAENLRVRYISGEHKRDFERGLTTGDRFLDEMSAWLNWHAGERAQLKRLWCDVFDRIPEAESLISQLAPRHELWLLSDTNDLHWTYLQDEFPILRVFSRTFLSYEQGALKSDPGAFDKLLLTAGGSGDRIVFFDDLAVNVAAARHAGLDAHLFRSWLEVARVLGSLS